MTKIETVEKPDGRKRRWRDHKIARREELVDGTLDAIRKRGANAGMDEIAAEIGVSKTVLYRYFTDKSDLTSATMTRFVETLLAPKIYDVLSQQLDDYEVVARALGAYVDVVAQDPEIYQYLMGSPAASQNMVADSERMIAEVVAVVLGERARKLEMDSGGSVPWAYAVVGGVQLAVHWWITDKSMSRDNLVDYLTMMVWGGIKEIARAGGSPARFRSADHAIPNTKVPSSAKAATVSGEDHTAG